MLILRFIGLYCSDIRNVKHDHGRKGLFRHFKGTKWMEIGLQADDLTVTLKNLKVYCRLKKNGVNTFTFIFDYLINVNLLL